MKTPKDKEIAFLFVSHPTRELALRWTARLTFPAGAEPATVLPIQIADGENKPVKQGNFEFAGQKLVIKNGLATIVYSDFIRGKHSVPLWLHRPGMPPIPGGLTFG